MTKNEKPNPPRRSELLDCFISPSECDRNLEAANVVDGLFAIARGLTAIADAIEERKDNTVHLRGKESRNQ